MMSFSSPTGPAASGLLLPQKVCYGLSPLVGMPQVSRLNSLDSPRSGEEPVAASTPFCSGQHERSDDPFDIAESAVPYLSASAYDPFELVEQATSMPFFSQQKTAYDPFEMLEQAASASSDPFESVSQQARKKSSDSLNKGFMEGSSEEISSEGEKVKEQTDTKKKGGEMIILSEKLNLCTVVYLNALTPLNLMTRKLTNIS